MELFKVTYKNKNTDEIKTDNVIAENDKDDTILNELFENDLIENPDMYEVVETENLWEYDNDDYVCCDCGAVFKEPDYYTEMHGFTYGNGETFCICPNCGNDNIMDKETFIFENR